MSVKVRVGFWWTRGNDLAYVHGRYSDNGKTWPWNGMCRGKQFTWADDGEDLFFEASSEDDLVEYIGMTHPDVSVRPKPEPKYVPWTINDSIVGLKVCRVGSDGNICFKALISSCGQRNVHLGRAEAWDYIELLKCWRLIDYKNGVEVPGGPCGRLVEDE